MIADLWLIRLADVGYSLNAITDITGRDAWTVLYQHNIVDRPPEGWNCDYRPIAQHWRDLWEQHDEEMPAAVRDAIARRSG